MPMTTGWMEREKMKTRAGDYRLADRRAVMFFLALIAAANILSVVNVPLAAGFKIHTFQLAIFIAGMFYGPVGGAVAGGFGSIYSAAAMGNPYILIGNLILGGATGFFISRRIGIMFSVLLAFVLQAVWIWVSDVQLMGMPPALVGKIILALLLSNLIWGLAAKIIAAQCLRSKP